MEVFNKIISKAKFLIRSLEETEIASPFYFLIFSYLILLRFFLELPSVNFSVSMKLFFHVYFFYTAVGLTIILLFRRITGEKIINLFKVIIPSFIVINIAPIVDLILSRGRGIELRYLTPHNNLLGQFFTFFNSFKGSGITPGMRVEIALILIGSFLYFHVKTKNSFKSFLGTLQLYVIIFFFLVLPSYIWLSIRHLPFKLDFGRIAIHFYLVISFIAGTLIFKKARPSLFNKLLKDVRPWRLAHYELMFGLGVMALLSMKEPILRNITIFAPVLIVISIFLAWLFSVFTNNLMDIELDKISNPGRPLVNLDISKRLYRSFSWILLIVSLLFSVFVSFEAFLIILFFIGNYCLYSVPPIRCKRIPVFSKLSISLNSLLLILLGYTIVGGKIKDLPFALMGVGLILITLASNFIDIKDYEGDKKVGIKTLPVLLGVKKSKLVIGLFFWLAYLSVYFISPVLAIPGFFLGMAQFFLINRKDYKEWPVFAVYLLSMIGLGVWWLL